MFQSGLEYVIFSMTFSKWVFGFPLPHLEDELSRHSVLSVFENKGWTQTTRLCGSVNQNCTIHFNDLYYLKIWTINYWKPIFLKTIF